MDRKLKVEPIKPYMVRTYNGMIVWSTWVIGLYQQHRRQLITTEEFVDNLHLDIEVAINRALDQAYRNQAISRLHQRAQRLAEHREFPA